MKGGPRRPVSVRRGGPSGRALDKEIVSIAVPSLVALSLDPCLTFVDTAFVAQLAPGGAEGSSSGLAAMGVAASVMGLAYPATNFFTNAATPLVAKSRDAKRLAGRICTLGAGVGIVLGVVLEVAGPWLVAKAGGGAEALSFTRFRALSAPAVVGTNALNGCLRGMGDARSSLDAAVAAAVVNVGLDVYLVPKFGADGAAISTAAAEFVGAAVLVRALVEIGRSPPETSDDDDDDTPQGAPSQPTAAAAARQEEHVSLGPFVRSAALTLSRSLALQAFLAYTTRYVSAAGSQALAANHILKSSYSLLSFATDALAVAAQRLVAVQTSDADARAVALRLLAWGVALGALFTVVLYLGAEPLVAIVDSRDPVVVDLAVRETKRVLAPLQTLSSVVFVADGILQGATAFKVEAVAMAFSTIVAAAALYYTPLDPGMDGPAATLDVAWRAVCVLQGSRAATFALWWAFRFQNVDALPPDDAKPLTTLDQDDIDHDHDTPPDAAGAGERIGGGRPPPPGGSSSST